MGIPHRLGLQGCLWVKEEGQEFQKGDKGTKASGNNYHKSFLTETKAEMMSFDRSEPTQRSL